MPQLTLLIDGEPIDYLNDEDFSFRLNRSIGDFKNPTERRGEFSYSFKLPLTERNRRVLGNLQALDQSGKFHSTQNKICSVYTDTVLLVQGRFFIFEITETEIECYLVSQVGSVGSLLKGKSLRDIKSLPDVDFVGFDTVIASTEDVYDANLNFNGWFLDSPICFPIICYGRFFVPNVWTSSNLTRYLPSVDFVPTSSQSFTSIPLPEGREILGLQNYYLNFRSQPHFSFEDFPPATFIVPILKAMFEDAGYALGGKWIARRDVQKLLMPYVNDREPIYNWRSLHRFRARSLRYPPDLDYQRVELHYTGELIRPGGIFKFPIQRESLVYDRQLKLSKNLYPLPLTRYGGSQGGLNFGDQYSVLYNVLHFKFVEEDLCFAENTATTLDQALITEWSTFTARTAGVYTFSYEFFLQQNKPFGSGDDTVRRIRTPRAFGCTKFEGEIPNNLCNGKTYDSAVGYDNLLYFRDMTLQTPGQTYSDTFAVELNRGDRVVFWVGMAVFETELRDEYVRTDNAPYTFIYQPPYDFFCTENNLNPAFAQTLDLDVNFGVSDVYITATVDNLPTTPERDQFGDRLKVAQNLPDLPQTELLKTLIALFNLYLIIDEEKRVVYLESRDDFYLPADYAFDITQRTNRGNFKIKPPDISRNYEFKWLKDDKDEVTKRFGGNYDYMFDTDIGQATDIAKVDSGIFASTEFRRFDLVETNNINDFVTPNYQSVGQYSIPHMASADDLKAPLNATVNISFDYKPRLLQIADVDSFVRGQQVGVIGLVKRYDVTTNASLDSSALLQRFIQLSFADTGSQSINLSWSGDTGLYRTWYGTLFEDLAEGYETEVIMLLTPFDYSQLSVNKPINYDGNIYYLKEIDGFNPLKTQRTKLKLFRTY